MDITRAQALPSAEGPGEYFTGAVRVDAKFAGRGALSGATVTFQPGEDRQCEGAAP